MKKVVLYNPSISTMNIGDEIIFDSVYRALKPLISNSFNMNVSTHLPISLPYSRYISSADEKFVCGTNLLRNRLDTLYRQWDINCFNVKNLGPCTLVGVGWHKDSTNLTYYTKKIYQKILSKDKLHSVRDNYTKEQLKKIGFQNVVNTGCATMWELTKDKCSKIPKGKAKKAVFTLTDYHPSVEKDEAVLNILKKEYEDVYIWLQGYYDYEYAKQLHIDGIKFIAPSLREYDCFLENNDVDYIGTRLHGGIRALQHGKRTMILAVDNRAIEKQKDFNLPVFNRNDVTEEVLNKIIYEDRTTDINIPEEDILVWKRFHGIV